MLTKMKKSSAAKILKKNLVFLDGTAYSEKDLTKMRTLVERIEEAFARPPRKSPLDTTKFPDVVLPLADEVLCGHNMTVADRLSGEYEHCGLFLESPSSGWKWKIVMDREGCNVLTLVKATR